MITTVKGNLFDAPIGSILVHACNCKGSWGAGIAKQFAKKFPLAFHKYKQECYSSGSALLGTALLVDCGIYSVGCLFTSKAYGYHKDSPQQILEATRTAALHLMQLNVKNKPVHMCKINSGLFEVDWSDTKKVLKEVGLDCTVYDF